MQVATVCTCRRPPPLLPRHTVQWGGHRGWQRACTDWSCPPKSWLCDKPSGTGGGGYAAAVGGRGGHRGRTPPPPPRSTCTSGGKRRPRRHPLPEGTSSPPQREAVAMSRTPGRTFCGCKAGLRGAGGDVQETACGAGAGGGDESGRGGGGGGGAVRPPRAHGRATEEVIPLPPLSPTGRLCAVGWREEGGGGKPQSTPLTSRWRASPPPPPHTHWGRWTPWPPHNALTRVTGTSSEICCSSGSQSNTHPQAPPYRCRPPCFWAVLRPCVCGAGGGGGALMLWVESGGLSSSCIDPPICGGGGGLRYYAYLFRCIIVISVLYRNRLGPFGGAGRWQA